MKSKIYIQNHINKIFGSLTIVEDAGVKNKNKIVVALCICGSSKEYRICNILSGNTRSCGCVSPKHGKHIMTKKYKSKHGLSQHPLYNTWAGMLSRCNNPKSEKYASYGGRGVKVSMRWENDFQAFYDWAIKRWKPGLQLDKDILASGQTGILYCPEFCCFVTNKQNAQNKSTSKIIEHNGVKKSMSEWADYVGISYDAIRYRLNTGWQMDKIISTPQKN